MREQRNDPKRLKDILQAIDTIFQYVEDRDMKEFLADKKSYHAVIYNIMIIGEAANLLTKDFRDKHSEVPWRDIVDMRNALVHGYIMTNAALVWDTCTNDLPILQKQISQFIEELNNNC